MRIALIGQAAFGAEVLKGLVKQGQEVVGVFCPQDRGARLDSLKEEALVANIPVCQPRHLKDKEAYEQMVSLQADLGVLAFVSEILPPRVFNAPRHGSICYHPSLLPQYRGASAINWAVINGETGTGFTVFWVDEGIDTGDILLQKEVEIDPHETTGDVYYHKLFPLGVEGLLEAVALIEKGRAPRIPQDHSQATYYPPAEDRTCRLDWNRPAPVVYDFIRGCDPQPGATTSFRGEPVKLYSPTLLAEPQAGMPGEILEAGDQGLKVALVGAALRLSRFRTKGLSKVDAGEFIKINQPKVGERFGY